MTWLVAFDVDGTLLEFLSSSWRLIHRLLGTERKADEHMRLFFEGKITYREWAELDASLWRGVDYEELRRKVLSMVKLREGAVELFRELRERGVLTALISSGVSLVVDPVAKMLGADIVMSNDLVVRDGKLTGEVIVRVGFYNKGEVLLDIMRNLGIPRERVIAVGDAENDIPMFRVAGHPIAFNPTSEEVARHAKYVIRSSSMRPLRDLILRIIEGGAEAESDIEGRAPS